MKKTIAILLSAVLLVSLFAVCASAKTWEDDQVVDENGDYIFDNAYGFVFNINYVDGVIAGEDVTLITNAAAYSACNPNWAISVHLAATETEGQYSVVKVVSCPGSADAAGITLGAGDVVLVAHSAYSNPNGSGYQAKCAAVALKEGNLIKIDGLTATVQNEDGSFASAPADDETSDAPSTEKVLVNFAKGASYTTSKLYQQGGADVEWGWDANAPVAWPDEDGKSLTDGVLAANGATYPDPVWAGFHAKAPDYVENGYSWITVDLGEVKTVSKISLNVCTSVNPDNKGAGISAPQSIEYFYSVDGENWESLGVLGPVDGPEDVEDVYVALDHTRDARYVQARMTSEGWMFVSEFEVYGYEDVVVEEDSKEESKEPSTPNAGDASNMIVFAVIALVALAGTAVVVKTRR